VAPNPLKANTASTDHHLYVLEAAGLLIGFEEITTPEVRGHYTACRARAFWVSSIVDSIVFFSGGNSSRNIQSSDSVLFPRQVRLAYLQALLTPLRQRVEAALAGCGPGDTVGDDKRSLGDAKSSLGDAESSLGDAKS
jgi:hypothetical protein